jgi:deazaflavin-dependent oxidoreductase (nitroreductase family)
VSVDWNEWNKGVIAEFRANDGKVGDQFEGATMAVITTTGAKTGAKRENPLVRLDDGGKTYVIASKGGAPDNPDWYYNLLANPEVTVELGDETFTARAKPVEDDAERDRLYAEQVKRFGSFADYEKMTDRRIPVIELERID